MKDFKGKIAVVTGGGTGMGRELARQLAAEGCHVATCDIIEETLAETLKLCRAEAAHGALVTGHPCDVADEKQVLAFRDKVQEEHQTNYINLLFNNAGVGGGGSFVESSREEWERTFNINWNGVYYFTRAFLDMLMKSTEGHIINTSSVNGFRASLGGNIPHTAYSTAKFAVKGFSESLINDFRFNAPHLKVSVVMPGYVGSEIAINTGRILGLPSPKDYPDETVNRIREMWKMEGTGDLEMDNDQIRELLQQQQENFSKGGLTPAQGAAIILKGVRDEQWRIFVGKDAEALDRAVRKYPLETYNLDFNKRVMEEWEE
ncbi:MAG: SDR family NAD(P)-dependent oxidoreductase [Deltaproteobacteria bacterium]|nr:SDR family NAD(P)-dependent oxidoreductase [Deltaproteobacteria bacterium]